MAVSDGRRSVAAARDQLAPTNGWSDRLRHLGRVHNRANPDHDPIDNDTRAAVIADAMPWPSPAR